MPPRRGPALGLVVLTLTLTLTMTPVPAAAAVPQNGSDIAFEFATSYPDRKTSSDDSHRFVQDLRDLLGQQRWKAEVLPYSTLVRTDEAYPPATSFLQASGENVLAYIREPSPDAPIDLLLVAPYDTLFEETGREEDVSYTCRATTALYLLAESLAGEGGSGELPGVALAFVSGRYQYGAGIRSLLEHITVDRGATVRCAIALGDIDALDSVPVAIREDTPWELTRALCDAAQEGGAEVTVVGPRVREGWYRAAMTAQSGAFSAESMLDGGLYGGEAQVLAEYGIPAITVGTPRNQLSLPLTPSSDTKVSDVASILFSVIRSGDSDAFTSESRIWESVLIQGVGGVRRVAREPLGYSAIAVALIAFALAFLRLRRAKDKTPLALLGGVALACLIAHPMRYMWFSGDPHRYFLVLKPYESIFLYVWSALAVIAAGTFRLVRVRARIAELHSKVPERTPAVAISESAEPPAGSDTPTAGAPPPAVYTVNHHANWAGPWALVLMAVVLLGASVSSSEMAIPCLFAVLGLGVAVLVDRPEKYSKPAAIALRLLGAACILPVILWAGSPFSRDAARIYAQSISKWGIESVAFTASFTSFLACVFSTFMLPAPKLPRKMFKVNVAEVAIMLLLVIVGLAVARADLVELPARAVLQELYGNDARVIFDATEALGEVDIDGSNIWQSTSQPTESLLVGFNQKMTVDEMSGTIRLSQAGVQSSWAAVSLDTLSAELVEEENHSVGRAVATFTERPAYYQATFQDVPLGQSAGAPFRLDNLGEFIEGEASSRLSVEPGRRYSVTVTWWMPKVPSIEKDFSLTMSPSSSRVDVNAKAVYLDSSYLGIRPATERMRCVHVTSVTGQRPYR